MELQGKLVCFVRNFTGGYRRATAKAWQGQPLPPPALDILLYLSHQPVCATAKDICAQQQLKPNLVSFHVRRLEMGGYLCREPVEGDRRKWRLVCTEKAQSLIDQGREAKNQFWRRLTQGFSSQELEQLEQYIDRINTNLGG